MNQPREPKHGRRLVLGAVSLTGIKFGIAKGRINKKEYFEAVNEARDRVEKLVVADGYCTAKPFSWVGLIVRQGLKDDESPEFQGIDQEHGDLALAIEIDTNRLVDVGKAEIQSIFEVATLRALVAAGRKYECSMEQIEAELIAMEA